MESTLTKEKELTASEIAKLPVPPGSKGLPLVGETMEFVKDPHAFVMNRMEKHGPVFRTSLLGSNMVFLVGSEANRWIYEGEDKRVENRWSSAISQLLGNKGVAMINGKEHRARRRLLSPHFNMGAMKGFVPTLQEITQRHLDEWAKGKQIVGTQHIQALAFEIAATLIMGDGTIDMEFMSKQFKVWTSGMFTLTTLKIPGTPFVKALKAKEVLMDTIEGIVRKRMAQAEQPDDILASLIAARDENDQPLDVETITHEIQVQLFAGHDTTVTALTNLLLTLSSQPEVVAKAREEALALPESLSLEDIKGMAYIPMVIYEGMRVQPPIQNGFRVAMEDIAYQGYRIPKDWTVVANIFSAHMQDTWTSPKEFDPERMNPHRAEQKAEQGKFIPFGGGPRICLGQHFAMVEMNLVLGMFLRRFNFSLQPGQNLKMSYLPFPLPKSGVILDIEERG
ncbi:MAG TPA: hypothetical protein DCP28_13250 [Cytophagales bacterium]|nr:hypothetical protein [Cytophagales bacterium]